MANYIPTSCTNAYIKISNTSAKCGHHTAPASSIVWLKTQYLCTVMDFLLLFLILLNTKKVCRRNHQAELTSQSNDAAHSDRSVYTLREKGALCYCHSAQELSPALQFAAMG